MTRLFEEIEGSQLKVGDVIAPWYSSTAEVVAIEPASRHRGCTVVRLKPWGRSSEGFHAKGLSLLKDMTFSRLVFHPDYPVATFLPLRAQLPPTPRP